MARSPRTYTPKAAAQEIGASADTIRRYCQLYRRHLSEGATPAPGRPRVLNAVDVYLLKLAKQATEAGAAADEVDRLLSTVALPEDLVVDDHGDDGGQAKGETLATTVSSETSESALALLRQMTTTLERLEAKERRVDQLADEVVDLRRRVEALASAEVEKPTDQSPPTWLPYPPFALAVAAVAVVILVIALVVALLT